MKTLTGILLVSFLFAGCATDHNSKGLTAADNAKGVQASNAAAGNKLAPVVKKISGKVFCGHGLNEVPASNAQVELVQNSITQFSGKTDSKGEYVILQPLEPKKAYFLSAKAKCGETKTEVGFAKNSKDLIQDLYLGED